MAVCQSPPPPPRVSLAKSRMSVFLETEWECGRPPTHTDTSGCSRKRRSSWKTRLERSPPAPPDAPHVIKLEKKGPSLCFLPNFYWMCASAPTHLSTKRYIYVRCSEYSVIIYWTLEAVNIVIKQLSSQKNYRYRQLVYICFASWVKIYSPAAKGKYLPITDVIYKLKFESLYKGNTPLRK